MSESESIAENYIMLKWLYIKTGDVADPRQLGRSSALWIVLICQIKKCLLSIWAAFVADSWKMCPVHLWSKSLLCSVLWNTFLFSLCGQKSATESKNAVYFCFKSLTLFFLFYVFLKYDYINLLYFYANPENPQHSVRKCKPWQSLQWLMYYM